MLGKLAQLWIVYPLLLLVTMVAWSVSSPPGSSPDEDFHLVSAWCALGTRDGLCTPGATAATRVVPTDVAQVACFRFEPAMPGECPSAPGQMIETNRGNFASYYPNGFYTTMGLLAGPSVEQSVIGMRVLNSTLYAAGLAALLFLAPVRRRQGYALGSLATVVPLGIFVVASTNPSSWTVTSATLIWASAVELARATDRRTRIGCALLGAFGLALAFASRADAAAYAGLAFGLALLLTVKVGRRMALYAGGVVVFLIVIFFWAQSFRSAGILSFGPPANAEGPVAGWFQNLLDLPNLYAGSFGTRKLGWLDTTMRPMTWVLAGSAYVMVIFLGLRRCSWRKAVALSIVGVLALAAPMVIATARQASLFGAVQPRYFLPLLILFAMIAIIEDNLDGLELEPARAVMLVSAIAVAHASALHTNLRRYLTGLDETWFNLNNGIDWWWSWAPPPMLVLAIGAAAFAGAAVAVAFAQGSNRRAASAAPRRALT